jgi:hypothetical protein
MIETWLLATLMNVFVGIPVFLILWAFFATGLRKETKAPEWSTLAAVAVTLVVLGFVWTYALEFLA